MESLFNSGTIADIILAVMVVEGLVLLALRGQLRGLRPRDVAGMLGAGLFLILALRAVMTGAAWQWTAMFLTAAFVAHLLDLWRQLVRRP